MHACTNEHQRTSNSSEAKWHNQAGLKPIDNCDNAGDNDNKPRQTSETTVDCEDDGDGDSSGAD